MEPIETTGSVTSDNSNSVMSRVKMFEEKAATPKKQQVVVARRYYDIKTRQQIPVKQTPKEKAPVEETPEEVVEERESTETDTRDATDDSRDQVPEIDISSAKKESPVKPTVWTGPTTPKKDSPLKTKVWTSPSNKASFSPRLGESSPAEKSIEEIKKKKNLESSAVSPRPAFRYQSPRAFNEAVGAKSTETVAKNEEVAPEDDAPPAQIQIEEPTKNSGTKSARLDAIRSSKAGLIAKEKRDLRRNLEAASTVMEEEKASSVGSGSSQSTRSSLSNEDLGNVAKRALKIAKVRGEATRTERIQRGTLHKKLVEKRLASKTTVEGSLQKQFDSEALPQFPTMTAPTVSESSSNASSVKLSSRLSRAERYANIRKQGHVKSGFKSDSKEEPDNHHEVVVVESKSKETHEDPKYSKTGSDEQSEVDSSSFKEIDDSSTITSKSSTTRSDRLAAISGYRNLKRNNSPIIITKTKNTVVQKSPSKLKDPPADIVAHQTVSSPSKSLAARAKRAKMLQAALEKTIDSEETEVANKNDSHHILASLNEMESPSGKSKFKGFHASPPFKKVPEEPMVTERQTESPKVLSDQIVEVDKTTNVFEASFPDPSLGDERNLMESLSTSSQSTSEPSRNYLKEKYLPEPTSAAVLLSSDVENNSMLLGEDISEVGSLDVSVADTEEEEEGANQEGSSERQTSPVKSTSDFSRESSGDDALRWWQKNYGENTTADTNQIVQNALAVVSPSRKLAVEDLKCTMQDRDSKNQVHAHEEVGNEPVQSFIDDESLFEGLEEEGQDEWQIRKKELQKDKNHAGMFPLSEETYSYSTEYSHEENRVSKDHGVGSHSSSVPPPPPPPQQGQRRKEHDTSVPKNGSRLVVLGSNQNSITSDLTNSLQRQPSNPSTFAPHRLTRPAREELTGNDIVNEIGKDIVDEIDNLIACIPIDDRGRARQRSRSQARQEDLLDDSVVVNSMAYGKAKREKDGQQQSTGKSSSGSSLLAGLGAAITDTIATVLRLPKKLTDANCTAPRAECTGKGEGGLDICRVPSPDTMSAMNVPRSPDTKPSTYLNMTEHERRLWNAWEDRHLEEPMYSNGDLEDALSDGTNSPKSVSKEKQQERRDKAQKELLEIAGLAVSLYGGQVSKNQHGATKAIEDLMSAPSDSLQGSSIGETMVILGEERETQAKDAARVPAQPPKALLEFSTLLKKKGVEVLKLGRSNKWQTRFLTVSKEVTFVKARNSSAGDVGQCPKALLWVKRFDSHAHDINQLKKLGRGGVMFSDLNKVEYVKGENTSASRSFETISKKLKKNFPAFHGCSVDYSFQEADGSKSNRSVMLCFKSREDADAFIMAIKIIKDALSR